MRQQEVRPAIADSFTGATGQVAAQQALEGVLQQALEEAMMSALVELLAGLLAQAAQTSQGGAQPGAVQGSAGAPGTATPATSSSTAGSTGAAGTATQQGTATPAGSTSAPAPQPTFTTGLASPTRPPSANLPDVSNESIPLELEDFTNTYHLEYGDRDGYTGWHRTDGAPLTPHDEAVSLHRASLLEHWQSANVSVAASNARAAGTTLSTKNMHVFLGDNATAQRAPDMYGSQYNRMSPQWVPGQGPPPAFDASGAPIPGSTGSVAGGATASGSGRVQWPPPPATAAQRESYERKVAQFRAGQFIISYGVGAQDSLPPAANPRTVELYAQRQLARYSTDDLAEFSTRMMLDAARFEAGVAQPSNMFFGKPALFEAFKSGNEAAFAAALG